MYNSENNVFRILKEIINKISKISFNIYLVNPLLIIERILRGLPISLKYEIMTWVLVVMYFWDANLSYKNKLKLNT